MASRTKQKEEARARRLEEERPRRFAPGATGGSGRLVGIVLVAVIVVVVAVVVSSGGAKKGGLQTGNAEELDRDRRQHAPGGHSPVGRRLGNPNAPVTMTYFGD